MFDRRLLSRMNSPKSIAANVHDTNHFFAQRNAYLQWKWYENSDRLNYEKQKRCGTIKMWIKSLGIYLLLLCDVAVNRFWYHTINQTRVMFFSHWFIFFAFFHRYFGAWLLNLHCGAFFVGFEFEADKIRCASVSTSGWLADVRFIRWSYADIYRRKLT